MDMNSRNQDRESWEQMMKENRRVKIPQTKQWYWEDCVKEYMRKQKDEWDRRKKG